MKKLLPLIIVLAFASCAFGQTLVKGGPKGFQVFYDKFKDVTQAEFSEWSMRSGLIYRFRFNYEGQKLNSDIDTFAVGFIGDHCRGYCFNDPTLIFLIDGQKLELPQKNHTLADAVGWDFDRETITRIANAKSVEFQVGNFQGAWNDKTLAKIKTLIDYGTVKK